MKYITPVFIVVAITLFTTSLSAQVVQEVVNTSYTAVTGTSGTQTNGFSFTTQTADDSILLVAIGGENVGPAGTGQSGTNDPFTITWDTTGANIAGVQLTAINRNARLSTIFAIDLGDETGETKQFDIFSDHLNTSGGYIAMAVQLSNADYSTLINHLGTQAMSTEKATGYPISLSWTDVPTGSYYLDVLAQNSGTNPDQDGSLTRTITSVLDSGSSETILGYAADVSEDFTAGYKNGKNDYAALSGVYVTAIPEPSTFALVGVALAGLLLTRRRR